jgi:hypothetical protein
MLRRCVQLVRCSPLSFLVRFVFYVMKKNYSFFKFHKRMYDTWQCIHCTTQFSNEHCCLFFIYTRLTILVGPKHVAWQSFNKSIGISICVSISYSLNRNLLIIVVVTVPIYTTGCQTWKLRSSDIIYLKKAIKLTFRNFHKHRQI